MIGNFAFGLLQTDVGDVLLLVPLVQHQTHHHNWGHGGDRGSSQSIDMCELLTEELTFECKVLPWVSLLIHVPRSATYFSIPLRAMGPRSFSD